MKVEICDAVSARTVCTIDDLAATSTIKEVKAEIYLKIPITPKDPRLHPSRQAVRVEPRGKSLHDAERLCDLHLPSRAGLLYLKDLGPQIAWKTVFLLEYAGPLFVYPIFYFRPSIIYGAVHGSISDVVHLAAVCWSVHYIKRLLETAFVHRFSHATMPLRNLFKNCGYYWGFAAFVAYYVNHPLYTPPEFGRAQIALGFSLFLLGELGNLSIHLLLRDLRPPGTTVRRVPAPNGNPLTQLFHLVSCPNYTYEAVAWLGFSVMTQCLPALMFAGAGFLQMAVWALGKHANYVKQFDDYPKQRRAIVPFLL